MAQIGTIKLQTQNSGVVDVPVFDTGDSGSGIYEFVRVETTSGTGFIPTTDPADATYPFLRVQSQNQGVVALTDTENAIPDSGIDNFGDGNLSEYTVSYGTISVSNTTTTVYNDYGVNCETSASFAYSNEGDGLPYYPKDGDTIYALVRSPGSSPNPSFSFNQLDGYGYTVRWQAGGGALRIYKSTPSSGIANELSAASVSLSTDTWYWAVISPPTTSDDTIGFEMRNADTTAISDGNLSSSVGSVIQSVSANDSEYVGQSGVGFGTNAGDGSGITLDIFTVNL